MLSSELVSANEVSEIYNFSGYFIFRRRDGIIHLQFEAGFTGGIEDAKRMVQTFSKLKGPGKALILAIYEDDNSFTKEAREFVASDEVSEIVKADAFVMKGLALRILANGYLRINKPKRPARIFNTSTPAIAWLKQLKD